MSSLIFSDTHLTHKFNPKTFEFLKNLISNYDQVIINGDFWCSYTTTFGRFVNSKWSKLFEILKSKDTIYIHGNHDPISKVDEMVKRFCNLNTDKFELNKAGKTFKIEHGHRLFGGSMEEKHPYLAHPTLNEISNMYDSALTRIFKEKLYIKQRKKNDRFVNYASLSLKKNEVLVCGHTHVPFFDQYVNYINDGFIRFGFATYLEISDNWYGLKHSRY